VELVPLLPLYHQRLYDNVRDITLIVVLRTRANFSSEADSIDAALILY